MGFTAQDGCTCPDREVADDSLGGAIAELSGDHGSEPAALPPPPFAPSVTLTTPPDHYLHLIPSPDLNVAFQQHAGSARPDPEAD